MPYKTEQEAFWSGEFGDTYTQRNDRSGATPATLAFWTRILGRTSKLNSVIELGANAGANLRAIRSLLPDSALTAVEINRTAADALRASGVANHVHNVSILDFQPAGQFDLAFTSGVLIHISPDELANVYDLLYRASRRYVLVAEYYNPTPVSIPYRGYEERLFKRDFAGELLDRFADLNLIDYGFVYHRDAKFPLDDLTWFLLEKSL